MLELRRVARIGDSEISHEREWVILEREIIDYSHPVPEGLTTGPNYVYMDFHPVGLLAHVPNTSHYRLRLVSRIKTKLLRVI